MTAHTPGPWTYRSADTASGRLPRPREYDVVKDLGAIESGIATCWQTLGTVAEANARLIAAAPDLLAACVALLNDMGISPNGNAYLPSPRVFEEAQLAIAKALTA